MTSREASLQHALTLRARDQCHASLRGSNPPAYAITPVTPAMGTEYMFVGLGCGVIGAYSLATGEPLSTFFSVHSCPCLKKQHKRLHAASSQAP
eukprot:1152903-Pelagomonas_calceolata.AAC.5